MAPLAFVVSILWIIPEIDVLLQQLSAVPFSVRVRQLRNTSWWASIGTKGKRKRWWVTSVFTWYPRREWSPLDTWLGTGQAPRWAQGKLCSGVFPSPNQKKKSKRGSSLSLAWLILPLLGIPKPNLSVCQFLWFGELFWSYILLVEIIAAENLLPESCSFCSISFGKI